MYQNYSNFINLKAARRELEEESGDMYAGASLLFTIQDRLLNYKQV